MSVAGGWVLVPLVYAAVVVGLGMLGERMAGVRLPGGLVPGVGLALLIVIAGVPVVWDATAEAAVPLVAGAAAAGFVVGRPWRDPRVRAAWPWPVAAAAGAFAVFAAPSLLSGQASIAGYVKLDDSATWMAMTDHVFEYGRDLSGVVSSSYAETLRGWLGGGYPVGAFLPLGVTAALAGQDVANAYQPLIAALAATAGLGLYVAVRDLAGSRSLAAGAALLAVQASLFLGYAEWGGIKEAVTVALLPPLALTVRRSPLLVAVGIGALGGVYGIDGLAWGAPAAIAAAVFVVLDPDLRNLRTWLAPVVAVIALVPVLATLEFADHTTSGAISNQDDFGNLAGSLSLLQGLGLWPVGDFRATPDPHAVAVLLAVACGLGALAGVAIAMRRRALDLPLLVAITLAGVIPALVIGSPWVDAKALAILSPVVLLATGGAIAWGLGGRGAAAKIAGGAGGAVRAASLAGAVVLCVGAVWSTVAVIRDVSVAPRARLAELREIAGKVGDRGPLVVLDFEIYADRHFLRAADPEGATDLRSRRVGKRDGTLFAELGTAEVDEVATPDLWAYRTIVRRRSPVASRPPAAFRRTHAGRFLEVWERDPDAPAPAARLPLSTGIAPVAVPDCGAVEALAEAAGPAGLAAAPRDAPVVVDLNGFTPNGAVNLTVDVAVPADGVWRVWVGGSLRQRLEVLVDGRSVGSHAHELAHDGQWLRFGRTRLSRGAHKVELRVSRPLRGGIGPANGQSPLGPLALTPEDTDTPKPVEYLAARDFRRLCDGEATYDWIEAATRPAP